MQNNHYKYFLSISAAFLLLLLGVFQVSETETAFVVRFGRVIRSITTSGVHFKIPLLENVVLFDKRTLQIYAPARELIASDQKRIVIDAYAKYRITDTKMFYESMRNESGANARLGSILDSTMRQVVATYPLISLLSTQRREIMSKILSIFESQVSKFGIKIIDVRIIKAELPMENSDAVFKRMRTDRQKEAQELRAEGKQESTIIVAKADAEAIRIKSVASMQASRIKGEADAKAARFYINAFSSDPEFYKFYRTMDAYKSLLRDKKVMLSTKDNSFLEMLKQVSR